MIWIHYKAILGLFICLVKTTTSSSGQRSQDPRTYLTILKLGYQFLQAIWDFENVSFFLNFLKWNNEKNKMFLILRIAA
jgi:hypothetical protein